MKKLLALLLALLFVFSLVACSGGDDTSEDASNIESNESVEESSEDESEKYNLAEVNYTGQEFTILSSGVNATFHSELVIAEENPDHNANEVYPDRLQEAIRLRNNEVYSAIGVKIKEIYIHDGKRYNGATIQEIRRAAQASEDYFQAVNVCLYDCGALTLEGLLWDLVDIENIDMSNPWWDQSVNKEVTIDGKQFFFVGDIGTNNKSATPAVFFNKTIFDRLGLEDPYQLVEDYKWTIDKAYQLCKTAEFAKDLNGDEIINYDDLFCWGGQNDDIYAMVYGSGIRILSTGGDGFPTLTLMSEKSTDAIAKIFSFMLDTDVYVRGNDYFNVTQWPMTLIRDAFIAGNAMFYSTSVGAAINFDAMEDDFGILPVPLYDENQTEYFSLINTWVSNAFGIAINISAEKAEFAGAVLDYMGYNSWRGRGTNFLATEYYDIVLKSQKLRNDEKANAILDKVFEARGCDLGAVFNIGSKTGTSVNLMLGAMMDRKEQGTFTSEYAKYESAFIADTQNLVDSFKNQ